MSSFDKVNSGLPGLDHALDHIRIGDNVVWQISDMKDYRFLAQAFVRQGLAEKRTVVYFRFAEHDPILLQDAGVEWIHLDVEAGFENFTLWVHEVITKKGREALYVFDSLSELQTVWATDLMMSNFFQVTCPYLFELDTVAYFALLRNRHSYDSIAKIRETTQLFLDVYSCDEDCFVHPLKVYNRYSRTMFLPHLFKDPQGSRLEPLVDGISASKFYSLVADNFEGQTEKSLDNWDNFFIQTRTELHGGIGNRAKILNKFCKMFVGKDPQIVELVKQEVQIEDFFVLKERMIGTGSIGGKAVGMLLARKIVTNHLPEMQNRMEPHDSFYIGSDVFYTYLVENGWWKLRLAQRTEEGYFSAARELKQNMLEGSFLQSIREQFRRILEYYGQNPIILRSSSLLEDSFGNAFAGKYESMFCANTGNLEERLTAFEYAVKRVYASSMDESALVYRKQRGMDNMDEQMAILVQRVSGSRFDDLFMPVFGGVGHSHNAYVWHPDIDPAAGMIRVVMGLGTRAVNRTDGDYPRVASLSNPLMRTVLTPEERFKYSQHYIDVMHLSGACLIQIGEACQEEEGLFTIDIETLCEKLPAWMRNTLMERDYEAEARRRELGLSHQPVYAITGDKLLKRRDVINDLKIIMATLQQVYNYPVDIEFTMNFSESGEYVINLLQCRPLQIKGIGQQITMPKAVSPERVFFELNSGTMGGPLSQKIDCIVQIDTTSYYRALLQTKFAVARAIGEINRWARKQQLDVMLIGPGRWGTSSPELGIPVHFAEISDIRVLCEVPYENLEVIPELSYGTHFFQDLVETDIFYAAIIPDRDGNFYRPELLETMPSLSPEIFGEDQTLKEIIRVVDARDQQITLLSDIVSGKTLCLKM